MSLCKQEFAVYDCVQSNGHYINIDNNLALLYVMSVMRYKIYWYPWTWPLVKETHGAPRIRPARDTRSNTTEVTWCCCHGNAAAPWYMQGIHWFVSRGGSRFPLQMAALTDFKKVFLILLFFPLIFEKKGPWSAWVSHSNSFKILECVQWLICPWGSILAAEWHDAITFVKCVAIWLISQN